MSLFTLLAELLRLSLIALDAVWITALAQSLDGVPHGTSPWAALAVVGALMVGVERLPRWYGRDGGIGTRLAALLIGMVPLSWLMARWAPELIEGWIAPPTAWVAALVGVWAYPGNFPLTVIALAGLLLWWRSGRISNFDLSQRSVTMRALRGSVLLVCILVWDALGGKYHSVGLGVALGGCIWTAIAFSRLRITIANPVLAAQRTSVGQVTLTVLLSTTMALIATWIVSRLAVVVLRPLLGALAGALFAVTGGIINTFMEWLERWFATPPTVNLPPQPTVTVALTPAAAATPVPAPTQPLLPLPSIPISTILFLLLLVVLFILLLRLQQVLRTEDGAIESGISGEGTGSLRDWLRERLEALRPGVRARRRHFGTETIRELYGNLLLFGDDHELPRPIGDTPYEYLEPLVARYPARRDDLVALTDAYVSLRYGERQFPAAQVDSLREALARIQAEGADEPER